MRPRVVIDVNSVVPYYVRGWFTGIGRTTKALVEALNQMADLPFEVMLYSQNMKGIGGRNMNTHFQTRHVYLPFRDNFNKLLGILPVRESVTGYDLYHVPHNFHYTRHPEKTIITLHDTLYFSYPEDNLSHSFARNHYPQLARECRGIITCSEASKRDIVQNMDVDPSKITVIPWGVDTKLFCPASIPTDNKQPYFLAVSCSCGRKNTISVVKAYQQLAKHEPRHRLILVWSNPTSEVRAIADSLHGQVQILSYVTDQQLAELYQHATCTFFPSRYEGFGLPILESMACGTPVVTCNNSSLPEVGGTAAIYVDPDDVEAMTHQMELFENGSHNLDLLRQRCVDQASQYTWSHCAEQTIDVYKRMLELS